MTQPKRHKSLTVARVLAAAEESMFGLEDPGFCTACGEEQGNVEPDARGYTCESCGAKAVSGAEELLLGIAG